MSDEELKKLCMADVQPENVTNRSLMFPGEMNRCRITKSMITPLTIKERLLVWLDCKFPRFMIFRRKLKGQIVL